MNEKRRKGYSSLISGIYIYIYIRYAVKGFAVSIINRLGSEE